MLITSKINECADCHNILSAVNEIDCYLAEKGFVLLNNKKFALTKKIDNNAFKDIVRYRNILIARSYNANYASFDIGDIINKVKQLINQ